MTQELIINGVNWLDPRFIGKECWFGEEIKGKLEAVFPDSDLPFKSSCDDYGNDRYDKCRLLQGDKTPYDGTGQQVPDGIELKVFMDYGAERFGMSHKIDWDYEGISHYQVQEQKPEDKPSIIGVDWSDGKDESVTAVYIPTELLQRIDVALGEYRDLCDFPNDVIEIDSLRKALSEITNN